MTKPKDAKPTAYERMKLAVTAIEKEHKRVHVKGAAYSDTLLEAPKIRIADIKELVDICSELKAENARLKETLNAIDRANNGG